MPIATLKKTTSCYVLHVTAASGVAYAVTGKLLLSLTLTLLEPAVQAIAFFFDEKAWQRWDGGHPAATPAARGA